MPLGLGLGLPLRSAGGGFTPPLGLVGWYDANDIEQTSGTAVTSWQSKGLTNGPPANTAGTLAPTYRASVINGHPVVRVIGGENSYLEFAIHFSGVKSVFVVARWNSISLWTGLVGMSEGPVHPLVNYNTDPKIFDMGGGSDRCFINGVETVNFSGFPFLGIFEHHFEPTSQTTDVSYIGYTLTGSVPNADIGEILLFNQVPTDAQKLNIRNYLSAKWGIAMDVITTGGLGFWLDPSRETFANDAKVPQLTDWSGNGYHLTQASVPAQPTFKTNLLNGKPGVRFDGINTFLSNAGAIPWGTIFVVYKRTTDDAMVLGTSASVDHFAFANFGNSTTFVADTTGAHMNADTVANQFHILACSFDTPSMFQIDGVESAELTAMNVQTHDVYLGRRPIFDNTLNGDILEVIFYKTVLPPEDINGVTAYLKKKFDIIPDPLYAMPWLARLQTHRGDNVPLGLWQDNGVTPATKDGDQVFLWTDVLTNSGLALKTYNDQDASAPKLRFVGGVPVVRFDGVDDAMMIYPSLTGAVSAGIFSVLCGVRCTTLTDGRADKAVISFVNAATLFYDGRNGSLWWFRASNSSVPTGPYGTTVTNAVIALNLKPTDLHQFWYNSVNQWNHTDFGATDAVWPPADLIIAARNPYFPISFSPFDFTSLLISPDGTILTDADRIKVQNYLTSLNPTS